MSKYFRPLLIALTTVLLATTAFAHGIETHESQENQETTTTAEPQLEQPCTEPRSSWRNAQTIAGVDIQQSERCNPDNPNVVAAAVKGTNNVPMPVLMKTGLNRNAIIKENDTDGDGDPDNIHITLEVTGVNEANALATEEIAPGVKPSFWTFSPKTRGMVDSNAKVQDLIEAVSPTIRVEEGDTVTLEIENTHYMPHTVHLHGVDHPYKGTNGSKGGDGVPVTSESPIPPGESREYTFTPETPGSMFYHCHVVPNTHVSMGLNGMFVIEENKEDNNVQTINPGAGKVRHPSESVNESYSSEYDMVYQDVDKTLHEIPKKYNDTREIAKAVNRDYDRTDNSPDYFLLNGKSFPYTMRESVVNVEPNKRYKMRVLNAEGDVLSLHTHGHKVKVQQKDGVPVDNPVQRDVIDVSAAQRVDLSLNTTIDGLNSYDSGVWLMHDHHEEAVTTDGISPGGNVAMISYREYLNSKGMPETETNTNRYFSDAYYEGKVPFHGGMDQQAFGYPPSEEPPEFTASETSNSGMSMMMGDMSMDMEMVPNGTVINENTDRLPEGCEEIRRSRQLTVEAGEKFAEPGEAYGYRQDEWEVQTCEKVTVKFQVHDEIRHQWMIHGLPRDLYPMGMFNLEVMDGGTVEGTFITPAEPTDLNLHCSLPQHQQKGMNGTVSVVDPSSGFFSWLGNLF